MMYYIKQKEISEYWVEAISPTSQKDNMGCYWTDNVKEAFAFPNKDAAQVAVDYYNLTEVRIVRE